MIGGMSLAADRPFPKRPILRRLRLRMARAFARFRHPPRDAARAALVGLGIAFTPTFGLRMPIVFLLWLLTRRRWHFHLAPALACTWVTNALVTLPLYYLFLVTGQALQGRFHDLSGYAQFEAAMTALTDGALGTLAWLLFRDWGATLWLGALPWSLLMGWLGYRLALSALTPGKTRPA
jgi:uncharacterized protein